MDAVFSTKERSRCRRGNFLGLEFGDFGELTLRRERIDLGMAHPLRLLYASDLHLGHWWTARVTGQILAAVDETRPDIVLLGGDLVDRGSALAELHSLTQSLSKLALVGAVPGNHDVRAGLENVRTAVIGAGGCWLPDGALHHCIVIDGAVRPQQLRGSVLCAHYPNVFPGAAAAGYPLVLSGHLHGGQCVLATRGDRLYPAAWLNRWHGLRFRAGPSQMFVSRGAGDAFPFRFRCPREAILCDLT